MKALTRGLIDGMIIVLYLNLLFPNFLESRRAVPVKVIVNTYTTLNGDTTLSKVDSLSAKHYINQ